MSTAEELDKQIFDIKHNQRYVKLSQKSRETHEQAEFDKFRVRINSLELKKKSLSQQPSAVIVHGIVKYSTKNVPNPHKLAPNPNMRSVPICTANRNEMRSNIIIPDIVSLDVNILSSEEPIMPKQEPIEIKEIKDEPIEIKEIKKEEPKEPKPKEQEPKEVEPKPKEQEPKEKPKATEFVKLKTQTKPKQPAKIVKEPPPEISKEFKELKSRVPKREPPKPNKIEPQKPNKIDPQKQEKNDKDDTSLIDNILSDDLIFDDDIGDL